MGNRLSIGNYLLILIICSFTFFVNNKVIIPDIMESRNMITAHEMVYDGNWMVPTMNGDIRLEKPPLPTWITAVAEMISPDNVALQRAMAGVAGVMLVIFFYLIAAKIIKEKSYALTATVVLCTCYNIVLMGRTASWDIYCHAFMLGAIYFLISAFESRKRAMSQFVWAGIFMGLSFMSKGPVSFYALLLPFLISYCLCYRPNMNGKWGGVGIMILLCIIIGGWWYAFIYFFHHDAMSFVANKESTAWTSHNVRPWYYYWTFFLETGVWSLVLLSAILMPLWSRREWRRKEYIFPLLWMLFTVVLLSLLPEKKNRYLLPVSISASYTIGFLIVSWAENLKYSNARNGDKLLYRINAWLIALVVFAIPVLSYIFVYRPGYVSLHVLILLSFVICIIGYFIARSAVKLRPLHLLWGVLALFIIAECFMMPLLKNIINNPEMNSISNTRNIEELKDIPFYYNQKDGLRIEMVYAAGKKIRPIDVNNVDSLISVLPVAILTHGSVSDEMPAELWNRVDTVNIGRFDDNRWGKNSKRYRDIFIYNITLLKKK